jgi:pimeloyl-ACP methyl ester carboxylesterase
VASELTVAYGEIALAVRDYGGDGPAVLLLHGAGSALVVWSQVAPELTRAHRVVAMDLRAHGLSGSGPWAWDAVEEDVRAVVDQLELRDVALVGHSLGGMLAVRCADRWGDVAAAVNVDGHGAGKPSDYVGMDAALVADRLAELKTLQAAQLGAVVPKGLVEQAPEAVRRTLRRRDDGDYELRPEREVALKMTQAIEALDLEALYRRAVRPVLVISCTQPPPAGAGPPWLADLHAASVAGLRERFAQIARVNGAFSYDFIDAGHAVPVQKPQELARRIGAWLGDDGRR